MFGPATYAMFNVSILVLLINVRAWRTRTSRALRGTTTIAARTVLEQHRNTVAVVMAGSLVQRNTQKEPTVR